MFEKRAMRYPAVVGRPTEGESTGGRAEEREAIPGSVILVKNFQSEIGNTVARRSLVHSAPGARTETEDCSDGFERVRYRNARPKPNPRFESVGQPTDGSDSQFRARQKPMLMDNIGLSKNMALPKGTVLPRAGAIASLVLLILLVLVPCAVLFFTVNPDSVSRHLRFSDLPVIWWAVWAMVSLWAGLDSSRWLRLLGKPVDPLGPQAVWGILLGILNVGASLLVVMLHTSR